MRRAAVAIGLLLFAVPTSAQTTGEQKAADIASWAVMGWAVASDVAECRHELQPTHCYVLAGVRNGTVAGASWAIKQLVHSPRPCAPLDCGSDAPYSNVPSGHTAFTAATMHSFEGGPRLVVSASATVLVGALRGRANKHDLVGVASGAAVGWAASFIR